MKELYPIYHYLEPEVAGGWGDLTVADTSIHPPNVTKFHYQFDGWLGDDILESYPCYIITEQLKEIIQCNDLTEYEIADVRVSKSDSFMELFAFNALPDFYWLKIVGKVAHDDFGIDQNRLVYLIRSKQFWRALILNTLTRKFIANNFSNKYISGIGR